MQNKKVQKSEGFDPLKVLKLPMFCKWMLVICHGGKFILQIYEGPSLVMSRSDSKYVIRGKSGGRQANTDRSKKIMSSTGSQMRRANEVLLT